MSLRWRCDGSLVCGAKSSPRDCDTYIDDRLHYHLSQEIGALRPDADETENGLWHWSSASAESELGSVDK